MNTDLDVKIFMLHKQGMSVAEIHRALNLGNILFKVIARSIAKSEMTVKFNHVEFNENYLIIPSLINYNFRIT